MATEKKAQEEKKKEVKEVKEAKSTISTQTILMIIGGALLIILLVIYIYRWQDVKDKEKYMNSYLLDSGTISLEIKNLDEVNQILSESPTEYFVLVTYTNDKDTYNLEKGLKDIIDNYKLSDSFYYLNIESIKEEDNYLTRINNAFNTDMIKAVPVILYYRDGEIVDTVRRNDDNCINAADFQKLLDIYDYEYEDQ